jgi:hypothetical protein
VAVLGAVQDARAAGLAAHSEEMVAAVRDALAPQYGTWTNFQSQPGPGRWCR